MGIQPNPNLLFFDKSPHGHTHFFGGIAMVLNFDAKTVSNSDFSFVQTGYALVQVQRPNAKLGFPTWRPEKIKAGDGKGIAFTTSLSQANPEYFVDASPFGTNPIYRVYRQKDSILYVDYPTFTRLLIARAAEDFPDATGVMASIYFQTYVVYKKQVVAYVNWSLTSTWYSNWFLSNRNFKIGALQVSLGTSGGDLRSNPMSAAQIAKIKAAFPDQTLIRFD
jgi:hypothetical protein